MDSTVFAREVVAGLAALPAAGTRLTASPAPDAWAVDGASGVPEVPTLVEDVRLEVRGRRPAQPELVIGQPAFTGNLHGELPGTPYVLRWVTDRGLHEVTTRYLGRERIGPALLGWRLRVSGPVSRIQRRAHARVPLCTPVEFVVLDDGGEDGNAAGVALVPGITVNLSEGGALAVVAGSVPALQAAVEVRFQLATELFAIPGRVVRHQPVAHRDGGPASGGSPAVRVLRPEERTAVAIAFEHPDEHGDRLRPMLFDYQLRGRRLGVA
ncbi:MAG TPA: PilZ domain-containing protein [Kineosporiaceae bacterium]